MSSVTSLNPAAHTYCFSLKAEAETEGAGQCGASANGRVTLEPLQIRLCLCRDECAIWTPVRIALWSSGNVVGEYLNVDDLSKY